MKIFASRTRALRGLVPGFASRLPLLVLVFLLSLSINSNRNFSLAFQNHPRRPHFIRATQPFPRSRIYQRGNLQRSDNYQKKTESPYTSTQRHGQSWDGDDLRWIQRLRRRIYRGSLAAESKTPIRDSLVLVNILFFIFQTVDTLKLIIKKHPEWWPSDAIFMISDTVLGQTRIRGGLTSDFIHSAWLSRIQPHRFLTAGFLHGNIIHLLLNMSALRSIPAWLETGLGKPLFLTTYLVSIIAGNIGHNIAVVDKWNRTSCLGASGGICGLYGLELVALLKMGRSDRAGRFLKFMVAIYFYGRIAENISNGGHFGGFLAGFIMGILFAPNYRKNYSMRRKWSLEVDLWPRDYRSAMGFGISPSKRGFLPVSLVWVAAALAMIAEPKFRTIPTFILRGILKPGSLSVL
mgnify:CR=1 FL=1